MRPHRIDNIDEACHPLLPVHNPQGVRHLPGLDIQGADPQTLGPGLALPKEQAANGVPAEHRVNEIENISPLPPERPLELRHPQPSSPHEVPQPRDAVALAG